MVNNSADGLDILLQPSGAPAFLPVSHLSDHLINCKALLSVYTPSTKLTNVVYYGRSKDKSMVSLYICAKLLALQSDVLSHSCTKLENRDFVSKFAERIEDTAVISSINDWLKPVVCHVLSRFYNLKFVSKI